MLCYATAKPKVFFIVVLALIANLTATSGQFPLEMAHTPLIWI